MFDNGWVTELDQTTACDAVAAAHRDLLEVETRQLVLAAHWIDLHGPVEQPDDHDEDQSTSPVVAGTGRFIPVGAAGTPDIDEFAAAKFATLQDLHPLAGANLLRNVANLRHRHPRLWERVKARQVRGWKALEVAKQVGRTDYRLTLEQARWVDAQTYQWIDTLGWGEFKDLLEAKIIACDPDAAEARRQQAAAEQFVATGQCNEYGLKTLIAKATAGNIIYIQATCDRIAQILALNGDTNPVGVRRATALGILATPARALALLQQAERGEAGGEESSGPIRRAQRDGFDDSRTPGTPGDGVTEDDNHDPDTDDPATVGEGDLHPSQNDADDPAPQTHPCPTCTGTGTVTGDPTAFLNPAKIDPARLLPRATLYIHLTQEAFEARTGVARMEDVGPITVTQARDFLAHTQVKVVPVIDLADRRPLDGYVHSPGNREAIHLANPRDVFPFAVSTSRSNDIDHPIPYVPPDKGGPPGQTNTGNAAPMIRFHHRLKTHGRWRLRQADPGTYLWRSPHHWYCLVDHTGTHPLTKHIGQLLWDALNNPADTQAA